MEKSKWVIVLSTAILVSGCGHLDELRGKKARQAKSGLELGYVGVSAYNAVAWHEVVDDFKPKFEVSSAEKLLKEVAPRVGGDYFSNLQRSAVSAGVQYQGTQLNRSQSTVEQEKTADGKTTLERKYDSTEGFTKKTPTATPNPASLSSPSLSYSPNFSSEYDPSAKYRAATALYQRIQNLNNYLDVPYHSSDTYAYLLRLQITVSPYTRNQAFDLHSRISLKKSISYSGKTEDEDNQDESNSSSSEVIQKIQERLKTAEGELTKINNSVKGLTNNTNENSKTIASNSGSIKALKQQINDLKRQLAAGKFDVDYQVSIEKNAAVTHLQACTANKQAKDDLDYRIFPLLVGDSLERVSTTRIDQVLRELSLEVGASGGQVAGNAGYEKSVEKLQALMGDRLNSLVSFTQTGKKDLTIRLNAAFDPSKERFALREKTFDVAFVVAVQSCEFASPIDQTATSIDARVVVDNQYRNTLTGDQIPMVIKNDIDKFAKRIKDGLDSDDSTHCVSDEFSSKALEKMLQDYLMNESGGNLGCWVKDRSLFLELNRARSQSSIQGHIVKLEPAIPIVPDSQRAIIADDTTKSVVKLVSLNRYSVQSLKAELIVMDDGDAHTVLASSISQTGNEVAMQFPSLRGLGYTYDKDTTKLRFYVDDLSEVYGLRLNKPASKIPLPRKSSFTLKKFANKFGEQDGGASAKIVIEPKNKKSLPGINRLRFSTVGGDLNELFLFKNDKTGGSVLPANIEYKHAENAILVDVQSSFAYKLVLLAPKVPDNEIVVTVTGLGEDGKAISSEEESITFDK